MTVKINKATRNTCFLIVATLILPLIGVLFSDANLAERHRRDLTTAPKAKLLLSDPVEFFSQSDSWISDRIFLSVKSPAYYSKFQYYWLKDSGSLNISRNKDIIFLNSHGSNKVKFSAFLDMCPSIEEWPSTHQKLNEEWEKIQSHAKANNVKAYALIIPSKPILYADMLPTSVPKNIRKSCMENASLRSPLKEFSEQQKNVVYPLGLFSEKRGENSFYPVQNFHFRGASASLAAEAAVSIMSDAGYVSPKFTEEVKKADLVEIFGFEREILVQAPQAKQTVIRDQEYAKSLQRTFGINSNQFIVTYNDAAPDRSKILVLSNSFGPYVSRFLSSHFAQVVQVNTNQFSSEKYKIAREELIENSDFDTVLFAMHETGYYKRLGKFTEGTKVEHSSKLTLDDLLKDGWYAERKNEIKSRWSIAGKVSTISIRPEKLDTFDTVSFELKSFLPSGVNTRSITIDICGKRNEALSNEMSRSSGRIKVDTSSFPECNNGFVMTILSDEIGSPRARGINSDKRKLGISIVNLTANPK